MTTDLIEGLGLRTWSPASQRIPDSEFRLLYGQQGEKIRGWMIHPLYDATGLFLGFDARHPTQKQFVKYRTPIARYAPVFGGLPFFFPQISEGYPVVLCEGLFDLAALSYAYTGPILSIGTAKINRLQQMFLSRFTKVVYLALDQDDPGRAGTADAVSRLTRDGLAVYPIAYRGGKDPGVVWDVLGAEGIRQEFDPALLPIRIHHGKLLEG